MKQVFRIVHVMLFPQDFLSLCHCQGMICVRVVNPYTVLPFLQTGIHNSFIMCLGFFIVIFSQFSAVKPAEEDTGAWDKLLT